MLAFLGALGVRQAWGKGAGRLRLWAKELESLRSQVDSLDAQVREARTSGLADIRALVGRRGELKLQLDRQEVRYRAAKSSVKSLEGKIAARKQSGEAFVPVVKEALGALREQIRKGLPYRVRQRLMALQEIEKEWQTGSTSTEGAAAKIWRFIEDELRLTEEVIFTKLPLTLNRGKARRMVRVARLGMVAMFAELGGGKYGHFVRDSKKRWRHQRIQKASVRKEVAKLFDALDKNILEGAYELPFSCGRFVESSVMEQEGNSSDTGHEVEGAGGSVEGAP